MAVIGLDLGGTKLSGAVFDASGEIIRKEMRPLEKRTGSDVGALITSLVRDFLKSADASGESIEAVGACVPGISWTKRGTVWAPNIPGWEDYPLQAEIAGAIDDARVPVKIDSDRTCYILGETWRGAAQGCDDAIFLAVGTGIGAGILSNGRIVRGSNDIAGAVGWLALDRPYEKKYESCGCFEHHASGEGIAKIARELLVSEKEYAGVLRSKSADAITAHDVFAAYTASDPLAIKTLGIAVEFWGMTAANLVSLFNPEKVIFGGGVFGPALQFLDAIYEEAKRWAQPISITQVKFVGSELGSDAGLYGAGYLALKF
ncbi:MAG: ROK family protein [Ignavibacteriales bacterium]|nr:ROK family protein [Ignavibacteriales bacterium]